MENIKKQLEKEIEFIALPHVQRVKMKKYEKFKEIIEFLGRCEMLTVPEKQAYLNRAVSAIFTDCED